MEFPQFLLEEQAYIQKEIDSDSSVYPVGQTIIKDLENRCLSFFVYKDDEKVKVIVSEEGYYFSLSDKYYPTLDSMLINEIPNYLSYFMRSLNSEIENKQNGNTNYQECLRNLSLSEDEKEEKDIDSIYNREL